MKERATLVLILGCVLQMQASLALAEAQHSVPFPIGSQIEQHRVWQGAGDDGWWADRWEALCG
jgi:hypothetical protein